ncbi:hypothetical protein Cni_G21444 [Canna indica]|uniref:DEAD-box ATP-dependent RNA helicase 33 n=1 Tax=Canna indica TaxID=4628 RepID=A0AAQ3KVT8_9LILI|nr:hypothetical protein Cni_G21444 [Canna indica]
MLSPILPPSVAIPRPPATASLTLSSIRFLSGAHHFPLLHPLSSSICGGGGRSSSQELVIRMGGGPRTYPGGVSKWQWKRMQAKKAKQLLKARLCRERQLYEMRKRTELRAAAAELERPWEVVERAPKLFSVAADEQLKALADRFQLPGGFDMWNDRDGPQVFRSPTDGLPSTRFFPKGVVHSVKPYGVARGPDPDSGEDESEEEELRYDDWIARGAGGTTRRSRRRRSTRSLNGGESHGSEEAIDVQAKTIDDEGADRSNQNATFSSKSSRTKRNSSRQAGDWRVSLREGGATDSSRGMEKRIERPRNRGNSQRQRFAGRSGWNEFDESIDYLKELKVEEDGEANSVKRNGSSRNHGSSRNQGFRAQFRSRAVANNVADDVGVEKMERSRSFSSGNGRSKVERRVTLRPTTELLYRRGRNAMENSGR